MKQLILLIGFLLAISSTAVGQLTVQNNLTAQQLANNLAGPNVTVYNAVLYDTVHVQTGTFNYQGSDLGLNAGVILSSGNVMDAIGPNSQSGTSGGQMLPFYDTDTILEAIVGTNINDYTYLEFEFEVQGDEIAFNYIFLSEEYNEFINASYNDAFAFVISGPGIVGEENLAIVPNTTAPITVHSINNNTHWQYYIDNDFGTGTVNIEFDGFTQLLTARKTGLQPCAVYKLSLRIADGQDDLYDSAVMLEANSLVSNSIQVVGTTYSADTTALEGCIPAKYTFDLGYTATQDLNIPIRLEGTALNGIDYQYIDSFVTIPQGQSSSTLILNALQDGLVEGREVIELIYRPSTSICVPEDTVRLYIDDAAPISYHTIGSNLTCPNDSSGSIQLTITGGSPPYQIQYMDTSTHVLQNIPDTSLPIIGLPAATYWVEVLDQYGCTAEAIVAGGLYNAGQTFLPDGTGAAYTNSIAINDFNVGQTLSSIHQINAICATLEHSYAGDLSIDLIAPNGAVIQLKGVGNTGSAVAACNLGEPVASGPTDNWSYSNLSAGVGYQYCWTNNATYPTMTGMIAPSHPGPPPTYTYTTLAGNSYTDYYLPAGSYTPRQNFFGLLGSPLNGNWTLRLTDNYAQDNGYLFDWSISLKADLPDSIVTLQEPSVPTITPVLNNPSCNGSDGSINLSIGGLFPPYSYLWSTGDTTQHINGLAAGSYGVSLTDGNSCLHQKNITLSNVSGPVVSAVVNAEACVGSSDGSIDLSTGSGNLNFSWSNNETTEDIINLAAGLYTVTISDSSNCQTIAKYTIPQAVPMYTTASIVHENCGDQEGEINLNVRGGAALYHYQWSNGATVQQVQDLVQGTYQVTITDANNCIKVDSFELLNLVGNCVRNCDLQLVNTQIMDETCANGSGSIELMAQSTGGTIAYVWSNSLTDNRISNLSEGMYQVTISDASGCHLVDSFEIKNQTNGLAIAAINSVNEHCSRGNGTLEIYAVGGILPYAYQWSNDSSSSRITNLSQGIYTCTITDASACSIVISDTIFNETGSFQLSYENTVDASCNDSTGSIDITRTGGEWPYTYLWSNGATTEDLRAIPAGNYSCTISENRGCLIVTPTYRISNDAGNFQLNNIDVDPEICGNAAGEIRLTMTGGIMPYHYLWSTGDTTNRIEQLSSGIYEVTITDSMGCKLEQSNLIVGNTSGHLSVDATQVINENCSDGTGSIYLSTSGNSGMLAYQWNTGSNAPGLSNLSAGLYRCTISDTLGCTVVHHAQVVNQVGDLALASSQLTNESCTQQNGAIEIGITGGSLPYAYQWSTADTTKDLNNLSQGMYTCTITDNLGCKIIKDFRLTNTTNSYLLMPPRVVHEHCNNSAGAIDIHLINNNLPLSYQWSNGASTEDITNLSQGTYTCTLTDSANCQVILGPYSILNTSATVLGASHLSHEVCNQQNGAIDLTIISGNPPYTYQWSNGASTEDITNLGQGTYTCTLTDSLGCTSIITETIQSTVGNFSIAGVNITDEHCTNHLGSIDLSIQGGNSPYTYQWSNGASTQDLANLNQGTYSVTVEDANTCQLTATYVVNNFSGNLQIANIAQSPEVCGNGQGAIDVTIINGQAPYAYQWSNGASTQDVLNLSSGIYTQTITDHNGCSIVHSNYISNSSGTLFIDNLTQVDERCNQQNGAINLAVLGGTMPYTYQWSNGDTTAVVAGLRDGIYTCLITDATGCTLSSTSILNDLGADLQISNVTVLDNHCAKANGAIQARVTGGNQPYTYQWTSSTAHQCGNYVLNMHIPFVTIGSGWWSNPIAAVRVSINNSIYGYYAVPMGWNKNFESALIPVCAGDSIQLEYLGNTSYLYAYELLDGQGNVLFQDWPASDTGITYRDAVRSIAVGQGTNYYSGITGGNYTLMVTDSNGCTVNQTIPLNNLSDSLQLDQVNLLNETCGNANGSIHLALSGSNAPAYSWSTGAITPSIQDLRAGTYGLTVTDETGCSLTDTYTILNNANGIVANPLILSDSCNLGNGAINLTLAGGQTPYSFNWEHGQRIQNRGNLSTGHYQVTITDAQSCKIREQFYVPNQTQSFYVVDSILPEICLNAGGEIHLETTGGSPPYVYQWSNGGSSSNLTGLSAGIYRCSITDATGCTYVWSDTVQKINTPISIPNAVYRNSTCFDTATVGNLPAGAIYLNAVGGTAPLSYLWSNGTTNPILENIYSGIYSLTVTDVNGCQLIDSFELELHPSENLFSTIDTTIIPEYCNNNQGEITVDFGAYGLRDYIWSTGDSSLNSTTSTISGLSAGNYSVTISQFYFNPSINTTCTITKQFEVPHDMGTLKVDSINHLDESCYQSNGIINPFISGGTLPYAYLWSNGDTSQGLAGITAGQYSLTVTDSVGCEAVEQGIFLNNLTFGLGIQNTVLVDEQCGADGSIAVIVSGGSLPYTYQWSNGDSSATITGLIGGTYYLTVTEGNGCIFVDSFYINGANNPISSTFQVIAPNCALSNGVIVTGVSGGVPPYTYVWSTTDTTATISDLAVGNYGLTVYDNNGCARTFGFQLSDTTNPVNLQMVDTVSTSCNNCTDGAINLTLDTVAAPYTFAWSDGSTTEDLANLAAGSYSVTITNADGCTLDTLFIVNTSVGIKRTKTTAIAVKVYPNPSNGKITLEFTESLAAPTTIHLYNNLGQIIYTKKLELTKLDRLIHLQLEHLVPGIYLLQLTSQENYFIKKIRIQ